MNSSSFSPNLAKPGLSPNLGKPGLRTASSKTGWAVLALSAIGLTNAIVLTREHYLFHTDPSYVSFCDFNEGFTCKGVALSTWSVLMGLPVSVWGIVGVITLVVAASWLIRSGQDHRAPASGLLALLSIGAVGFSVVLTVISTFLIGALCPLCLFAHGINVTIALICFVNARRYGGYRAVFGAWIRWAMGHRLQVALPAAAALAAVIATSESYPNYWRVEPLRTDAVAARTGTTDEGLPWIGAANPEITVVEYSDYQCPHCRRGHREVRKLVDEHPDCVRLVHCQYPLDHHCNPSVTRPMHEQACDLACLAYCAGEQGRFWEANDYLFSCEDQGEINAAMLSNVLQLDSERLQQCMTSDRPMQALRRDMDAAAGLGVKGTPTFVVRGQLFPGHLPAEVVTDRLGTRHDG